MYTSIARRYVKDAKDQDQAQNALKELAADVCRNECDTWGYLVHNGSDGSLPPSSPTEIIFVEIYKDEQAFLDHVNGPAFQGFLKKSGHLFVNIPPRADNYFFQAEHIDRISGFVRDEAAG